MRMQKFEKIIQKIDPTYRLIKTWQVKGGISAEITGLEIGLPDGATQKLIVRRHGDDDFKGNPQIAAHEFHLLQFLKTEDIPVAKPYYLDETDEILGRPYLVLEYIEGHTEFDPANLANFLLQFATNLAKIHCIHYSQSDFLAFCQSATIFIENFRAIIAQVLMKNSWKRGFGRH